MVEKNEITVWKNGLKDYADGFVEKITVPAGSGKMVFGLKIEELKAGDFKLDNMREYRDPAIGNFVVAYLSNREVKARICVIFGKDRDEIDIHCFGKNVLIAEITQG